MMDGGYQGKILRVNLTDQTAREEPLREDWAREFIGGRGYGTRILMEEVDPRVDPLAPENKVVIATGPLDGTTAPSSGRVMVITKGALNGAIASSNAGGYFGPMVKRAGYDLIIIEGKSPAPVYLWINKGTVEFRDASHLWGKLVPESDQLMREETHLQAETMVIGPAGEKLSRISGVMFSGHRASGRTGVGAVVGSKNLKGIAVRGTLGVTVADHDAFLEAVRSTRSILAGNPVASGGLPTYGSAVLVNIINSTGSLPVRNAQEAFFPEANNISGESLRDHNLVRNEGCADCPLACGRVTEIREGTYKGEHGGGPEYESVWSFGAMCGVSDLDAVVMANFLCDRFGIDTISAGSTVACAMELYERGYMPKDDAPFPLRFGDAEAMVECVRAMGEQKDDFGRLLAQGSYRVGEHYGHPELSMTAKKQEFPAYDPRGIKGIGLEYATSNRGACHVRGYSIAAEVLAPGLDRLVYQGKAQVTKFLQDLTAALDSAGICLFTTFGLQAADLAQLVAGATGFPIDEKEFLTIGERIWNMEKLFNLKAGFTAKDDTLPPRILHDPIPAGPSKGEVEELDKMLGEYYTLRGWGTDSVPTKARLTDLGIAELA